MKLLLVALIYMTPLCVLAQSDFSIELNSEIESLEEELPQRPRVRSRSVKREVVREREVAPSQPLYVPQNSNALPDTVIEARPLRESRADRIRKQREAIEQSTELKIVEELERDRIHAEQERAERIFGNKIQSVPEYRQPEPLYTPQEERRRNRDDIREVVQEIRAEEEANYIEEQPQEYSWFFGALFGAGDYPDVNNVKSISTFGFLGGVQFQNRFDFEFSYAESEFDIENQVLFNPFSPFPTVPTITEMNQQNFAVAVKYKFLEESILRPFIGGATSYTRRNYTQQFFQFGLPYTGDVSSDAFDLGFVGGADLTLGRYFTVGAEIRYMFNMTNQIDSNYGGRTLPSGALPPNTSQIEELDYYIFSLGGKFFF